MTTNTTLKTALNVWKALLLREGVRRFFGSRAAWFWLIANPVIQIAFMSGIFTFIRQRQVGGMDVVIWLVLGVVVFNLFRRCTTQGMNAISSNKGLLAFPQVKPVDAVFMRVFLELFILTIVMVVISVGLLLFNKYLIPENFLQIAAAFLGMWLMGVGVALIASAFVELVDEVTQLISFLMMPLYLISGVIIPLAQIPQPYRDYLLLNPLTHGVEAARAGFSSTYHAFPELDIGYLYIVALVTLFLGLLLQQHFNQKLSAL